MQINDHSLRLLALVFRVRVLNSGLPCCRELGLGTRTNQRGSVRCANGAVLSALLLLSPDLSNLAQNLQSRTTERRACKSEKRTSASSSCSKVSY